MEIHYATVGHQISLGGNMKIKTLLLSLALSSTAVSASGLHLSPELKLGDFHGFGFQIGASDTFDLDALYFSYSETWYKRNNYDETINTYRLGMQQLLGTAKKHGFQAEIGLAAYDGERTTNSAIESKSATGLSLGGAYVYQATENIGLRAGLDFNFFDHNKTFEFYDTTANINLGVNFSF